MIEFVKNRKDSFFLRIPRDNVTLFYNYLDKLDKNCVSIMFNGKEVDFEIVIDEIAYDLIIQSRLIKMYMDDEELDFFKYRLKEVIEGKDFYPSEICERQFKNKNVTICCFIV